MRSALIGGIGNVLLGDDAVGPYVLRLLESQYSFQDGVDLIDLGTPALDLTHQILGLRALILIDSVASDDPPGTVVLYRKEDILAVTPAERVDPHSPALSECLLTAEMLGGCPEYVVLVGIVGAEYEPGQPLSAVVEAAVATAMEAVVHELNALGYSCNKRAAPHAAEIWWAEPPPSTSESSQL